MTPTPTTAAAIEPPQPATIALANPLAPTRARHLTVGYLPAVWPMHAPRPDPLPYLRLRGRWLKAAGFAVDTRIRVRVEPQRLILEVESDAKESDLTHPQPPRAGRDA
jgi:hypothetical protein